ncbi:putative microneme protein [Besnoitia besnoiti]|uniref:Putative microneme protein n=1 Tax=Besnoitia besnoiti TaxID=94643 RepID=A0A2A9M6U1_BESBE|nr:putative microneme protein [Besnoitia besnoiti]PFH31130.1 putative microneme protein [Besnoitia besnoiti]
MSPCNSRREAVRVVRLRSALADFAPQGAPSAAPPRATRPRVHRRVLGLLVSAALCASVSSLSRPVLDFGAAVKLRQAAETQALAEAGAQREDAVLPARSEWLCREAYNGEGCGSATNAALGATEAYCQEEDCCPTFKPQCTHATGLCATESYLQQQYSWGKCNKTQCARCGPNAVCGYVPSTSSVRGGVYCTCKNPFVGSGASCMLEVCKGKNPCGEGTCVPSADSNKPYDCECSPGYAVLTSGSSPTCMDICKFRGCGDPEGVEACIGGVDAHVCVCKLGYRLAEDSAGPRCVKSDPCTISPCGQADAVEKCEPRPNGIEYVCTCTPGHVVRYVNGTQVCLPEEQPCNAPLCSLEGPDLSSATSTSTSKTATNGATAENSTGGSSTNESEGVNAGAIAGGVVGGLAGLGLIAAAVTYSKRRSAAD